MVRKNSLYTYNIIIKKIVDGDTIRVDIDLGFDMWLFNQSIRLYGIDAPESRTTDLTEKKFGMASKKYIEEILPIGSKQLMISAEYQSDKFSRILAKILIRSEEKPHTFVNLNEMLIDNHLAVKYDGNQSKQSLKSEHIKNRKYLIKNGYID